MDCFRPHRAADADRFLRIISLYEAVEGIETTGFELNEEELFAEVAEDSKTELQHKNTPSIRIPSHSTSRRGSFRRDGILAALPEDELRRLSPLWPVNRRGSISAASFASASTSPASSGPPAARTIPAPPKPKPNYEVAVALPNGGMAQHSAPVNVPLVDRRARRRFLDSYVSVDERDGDGDEDEMLPPHEIVARVRAKESPMTTFSVLEGAGRTLKGRDLRQVRNAVWRKTGFLD